MAKTWYEKLNVDAKPHVEVLAKSIWGMPKGGKLFIATPLMVKRFVDKIPRGKSVTVVQMRERMAKANKADGTCPLTSAIFLRIVSEAAWDELQNGKPLDAITPFWRIVEPNSTIAKKLACGTAFIQEMRKREGIA